MVIKWVRERRTRPTTLLGFWPLVDNHSFPERAKEQNSGQSWKSGLSLLSPRNAGDRYLVEMPGGQLLERKDADLVVTNT